MTFSRNVAPIFYRSCTGCHRPGEIGPMSLLTYKDARRWSRSIKAKVTSRSMPPWHADPQYGKFVNDRSLSQQEIDTIAAWVDAGAPEGDPTDLPAAPKYVEGWNVGTPDVVFSMPQEFEVPAEGVVEYQYYDVPTNFTEDRWVQAVEIRPGNRSVTHHAAVYVQDRPGTVQRPVGVRLRQRDFASIPPVPGPNRRSFWRLGPMLSVTAGGTLPYVFPPGAAMRIKAGSKLTFQLHYTPNGTPARDLTRIGLIFAKEQPAHELHVVPVLNGGFTIPAGAPNHKVEGEVTFTQAGQLWALAPHMHMRGKRFEYKLIHPDGSSEILLVVPRYEFQWQNLYVLDPPIQVPKGSRVVCTGYFDNSSNNPHNPDPTKDVTWGEQTFDEMMVGFTTYSIDRDASVETTPSKD